MFTEHEQAVLDKAATILKNKLTQISKQSVFESPEMVREYCRFSLVSHEREVFGVLLLDNMHRLIDSCELFYGSVSSAEVYPREVVKLVLSQNASAVIFYHNHPSHSLEPSSADKRLTRKLTDALALIDVRVLDHFIVTVGGCTAFSDLGFI
ncbi:JAB domain-containing protein [Vibrio parahaemolyticus]